MKHRVGQLEKFFLQLLIFTTPLNLAYHFGLESSFLRGRLVDYLLPKIYLSDIIILSLLCILLVTSFSPKSLSQLFKRYWFLGLFFVYLLIITATGLRPLSGIWFWAQLVKLFLFSLYLHSSYTFKSFLSLIYPALLLTLGFQFLLSLYQFIFQQSLFPYAILGEVNFQASSLVMNNYFGQLLHPPYATTPHPNVLAGLFTIYTLCVLICSVYNPILLKYKVFNSITICLSYIVIFLTQSLTAFLAFTLGIIFLIAISKLHTRLIFCLLIISTLLINLFFILKNYQLNNIIDLYSITRRYKLFHASVNLLKSQPLTGVGLNQFVPAANEQSLFTDPGIYLQPVHNIYLLWTTEAGLLGSFLLLWCLFLFLPQRSRKLQIRLVPLIALLMIGILDHYPYTLQTGQLLLTLTFSLIILRLRASNNPKTN